MSALYVYAVVPEAGELSIGPGIAGRPVRAIAAGGVKALVHELETPTPYAGDDAQVQRWVQEHFAVVEQAWSASGTVLPMTFDVLIAAKDGISADARLSQWLSTQAGALQERLTQLKDRCELKVEVRLGLESASGPALEALESSIAGASRGMRVLLEKKREQVKRTVIAERADALHAELREALCAHAVDVSTLKLTRVAGDEVAVLAVALLVDNAKVGEIGEVLGEFQSREQGLRISFLGPWPPFHFAELVERMLR